MSKSYGVLVDGEGYFLAALQWEADGIAPSFGSNEGKELKDQRHLLTSETAILVSSEKARWDFGTQSWSLPTERYWVVDQRGTVIGGTTYWPARPPSAKPGTEIVLVPPPARDLARAKPVWDTEAQSWKDNRRVALIDEDGLVIDVQLENPRSDTENVVLPNGWEREDDDGGLPLNDEGQPVGIGSFKDGSGGYAFLDYEISKLRLQTVIANLGRDAAWQTYLEGEGLWDQWQASSDTRRFRLGARDKLVIKFALAQGYTKAQIINFIKNQLRE